MIRLKAGEKRLAILAGALVAALALQTFVIGPIYSRLQDVRRQIQKQSLQLSRYTRTIRRSGDIQKIYEHYVGLLKVGATIQEEVSGLLKEVDQMADRAGIRIIDLKPLEARDEGVFKKLRVEIEIEASQASLGRFLFALMTSSRLIHVDQLKINAGLAGQALRCNFILSVLIA